MDGTKDDNDRKSNYAWRKKPRKFAPKSRLGCKTCKYVLAPCVTCRYIRDPFLQTLKGLTTSQNTTNKMRSIPACMLEMQIYRSNL